MSDKFLISLTVLIATLVIFFGIYFESKNQNKQIRDDVVIENNNLPSPKKVDKKTDIIIGNENAEVFIIEYTDLEYVYCKKYNDEVYTKLVDKWSDEVGFVFRHFPLKKHLSSFMESVALECANKLGGSDKFISFKDIVYSESNSDGMFTEKKLDMIGLDIDLNLDDFKSCRNNQEIKDRIQDSYNEAIEAKVNVTPSVFIEVVATGQVIPVPADFETIDESLKAFFSK